MAVATKKIEAEAFQWDFYTALNRFPSMIAGVGTGKTMWALMKGDLFSRFYKNNLGLIVRNKFTDLRDSTMKDYTGWTGKTIPQGTKEAHYANGSVILFRHAKELSGLKNVNLGWVYIEQAEEFPTDTQFQMLRFRLRRELEVDEDYWDGLVRVNAVYPFLQKMHDKPLNQMMTIANANGHNWCWKLFVKSPPDKEYSCIQANSFQNTWLVENKPETIADWRRMEYDSPAKFKQYVMNDHSEIDLEASYYAPMMSDLRRQGRIGVVSHNPEVRVHLAADIGMDCTSIGFFQPKGTDRHIIDYYENTGKPIKHYATVLDDKKKKLGYDYGTFFMPHDAKKREMVAGLTLSVAVKNMGYSVKTLEREANLDNGINRTMNFLPRCRIDEKRCEMLIEALEHYRREYDEENRIYLSKPLHDWASHPADMIRTISLADKKGLIRSGGSGGTTIDQIRKWQQKWRRVG
jgi:hypothetical protein